jgi:hypothetical protein
MEFLAQNKAKLCKNRIITLVFEKNANFCRRKWAKIAENCDHNIDPLSLYNPQYFILNSSSSHLMQSLISFEEEKKSAEIIDFAEIARLTFALSYRAARFFPFLIYQNGGKYIRKMPLNFQIAIKCTKLP